MERFEFGSKERQYLIDNLDKALENGWIQICYQPIVRATNGKVCNEEALSRWQDPTLGLLVPEEFVPILEEAQLTYKLDLYVIERVLEKLNYLKEHDMIIVPQSINLSFSDFITCDIVEELRCRVDKCGVSHHLIYIELAEGMMGNDLSFMKTQIERFRELGFAVCMDNFGSGYSSLEVLHSVKFDLIKFDTQFMQKLNQDESGRIILTELMKMAFGLGIDTISEGVESEEAVQFLREIGCEKLQGYYYGKAISLEEIIKRYDDGYRVGFENPEETEYYDSIGRINLYDLAVVTNKDEGSFRHYFNMIPMAILEITGDMVEFVRTNQAYREFVKLAVGVDVGKEASRFSASDSINQNTFLRLVMQCSENKSRMFVNEKTKENATVHSFVRWLGENPVTGTRAVAVVVLAIVDSEQEATYESIARALAADYFNLIYVDLDTGRFIEYSSDVGQEELAIERHGEDFFGNIRKEARNRIYEEDRENFIFSFTKENILRALDEQGTFTMTYRQMVHGIPVHVNMKAMRMQQGKNNIIIGVNRIDEQVKLEEGYERSVLSSAVSGTEAEKLAAVSLDTAAFAVKSCVKLMESGDFKENVKEVLKDIRKVSKAQAVRIMLVDKDKKTASIFAEDNEDGVYPERKAEISALRYDMVAGWEKVFNDDNAVIIESDEDISNLEPYCPEWAAKMRHDKTRSMVLVPLLRKGQVYGYLYVVNYNTLNTAKMKELIELVSFFLSSEISNYLFRTQLETLSTIDELTGLKNRYAMLQKVHAIEDAEEVCSFGVLTMDLNGLKRINDTEGHLAGDALITRTADMLSEEFDTANLFRIGGDEFIEIFPGIEEQELEEIARRFREGRLKDSGISMAMGTCWTEKNRDLENIFYHADQNMYANKKAFYDAHPELKEDPR